MSGALIEAATATFARRASHPWLPALREPPAAWTRQYAALRKEMALDPPTAQEAHAALIAFLVSVLGGMLGLRWNPSTRTWQP